MFDEYPLAVRRSGTGLISVSHGRDCTIKSGLDRRSHGRPKINAIVRPRGIETLCGNRLPKSLGNKNFIQWPSKNSFAGRRNASRIDDNPKLGLEVKKFVLESIFFGLRLSEKSTVIGFLVLGQFEQIIFLGFIFF